MKPWKYTTPEPGLTPGLVVYDHAPGLGAHGDAAPWCFMVRYERGIGEDRKPISLHAVKEIGIWQGTRANPHLIETAAVGLVKKSDMHGSFATTRTLPSCSDSRFDDFFGDTA